MSRVNFCWDMDIRRYGTLPIGNLTFPDLWCPIRKASLLCAKDKQISLSTSTMPSDKKKASKLRSVFLLVCIPFPLVVFNIYFGTVALLRVEIQTSKLGTASVEFRREDATASSTTVQSSSSPISIFYNVFVPPQEAGRDRTLDIVREQLGQFDESDAARLMENNLTVYYSTIGFAHTSERIQELCTDKANINCQHMEHYDAGFEEVTLNKLLAYCKVPGRENDRVVYLHNKGSYTRNQDDWRRYLTLAATHRDCVCPPDDQCNLCSIHLWYLPNIQNKGNFWSAKCSYVKRLMTPLDYQKGMTQVEQLYRDLRGQGKMHHESWGAWGPWGFARGRESNLHWIGSHPAVRPCDLNPFPDERYWLKNFNSSASDRFQWEMLPRRGWQDRNKDAVGDAAATRFQTALNDVQGRKKVSGNFEINN